MTLTPVEFLPPAARKAAIRFRLLPAGCRPIVYLNSGAVLHPNQHSRDIRMYRPSLPFIVEGTSGTQIKGDDDGNQVWLGTTPEGKKDHGRTQPRHTSHREFGQTADDVQASRRPRNH